MINLTEDQKHNLRIANSCLDNIFDKEIMPSTPCNPGRYEQMFKGLSDGKEILKSNYKQPDNNPSYL